MIDICETIKFIKNSNTTVYISNKNVVFDFCGEKIMKLCISGDTVICNKPQFECRRNSIDASIVDVMNKLCQKPIYNYVLKSIHDKDFIQCPVENCYTTNDDLSVTHNNFVSSARIHGTYSRHGPVFIPDRNGHEVFNIMMSGKTRYVARIDDKFYYLVKIAGDTKTLSLFNYAIKQHKNISVPVYFSEMVDKAYGNM